MQAKELRIGNLVEDEYKRVQTIAGIEIDPFSEYSIDFVGESWAHISKVFPIPLTEEWLIKFGFEISRTGFARKNDFQIGNITIEENYQYEYANGSIGKWILKDVKYVHQLQNLYFALTGEELTLK